MGLVGLGVAMQLLGAYYFVGWLSGAAIIAYIGGATVLVGGWPALRWAAPAIVFLLFMIPLPHRIDVLMHQPLQKISTRASGVALQMLGLPAIIEGNVIVLDDVELGVVDACSGLKMFIIFFCLSTAIALLAQRHLLERIFIVLSAAPIAIVCNVARITATGRGLSIGGRGVGEPHLPRPGRLVDDAAGPPPALGRALPDVGAVHRGRAHAAGVPTLRDGPGPGRYRLRLGEPAPSHQPGLNTTDEGF